MKSVQSVDHPSSSPVSRLLSPVSWPRRGFTLVEMLVVMAILVVMMAAVGEIFQTAGHTVRLGQATLQMMAGVRTVESQINHDLAHIDPNGYLIIRGSYLAPYWEAPGYVNTSVSSNTYPNWDGDVANTATPAAVPGGAYQVGDQVYYNGAYYACVRANTAGASTSGTTPSPPADWMKLPATGYAPQWQDDQLTFLAHGTFHDRTGSNGTGTGNPSPFMDNLTSNAAAVWYGQLFMEPNPANGSSPYPQPAQGDGLPPGTPPTGATAGDFVFGRHATLLVPGSGSSVSTNAGAVSYAAFSTGPSSYPGGIAYAYPSGLPTSQQAPTAPADVVPFTAEPAASITSSRVDTAIISPTQIEQALIGQTPDAISMAYCYRFCALPSPAASTDVVAGGTDLVNGYFRMTPILLQGVPSFTVEWTDGSINATGTLNWYGLIHPIAVSNSSTYPGNSGTSAFAGGGVSNASVGTAVETTDSNDQYVAVFDAATRQLGFWPKALKITFTVTDSHNLLQGGRVITEVVRLPQ